MFNFKKLCQKNKQGILKSVCLACFKYFYVIITFFALVISIICHNMCEESTAFALAFTNQISYPLRKITAKFTDIFPFSVGEILIVCLVFLLILKTVSYIIFMFKYGKTAVKKYSIFILRYISVIVLLFSICICDFFVLYKLPSVSDRLGYADMEVTAKNLYDCAVACANSANKYAKQQLFLPSGASVMPYSHKDLCDKLNKSFNLLSYKYSFITPINSKVKHLAISPIMTYTHLSGMYMPFTGEATVNTNYPDYIVAFTYAHEMAHQRGISSEDEANFIGYLTMLNSGDPYLIYSANISMLDYLLSELNKTDKDYYQKAHSRIGNLIRGENEAYGKFFKKYSNSKASAVADKLNDTYLKSQGQSGVESYSDCVNMLVACFKNEGIIN